MAKRKAAGGGRLRRKRKFPKKARSGKRWQAKNTGPSREAAIGALHAVSDALIISDAAGRVVFLNQAAIDLYGKPELDPSMQTCARAYGVFKSDGQTLLKTEELPLFQALHGEVLRNVMLLVRPPLTGKNRRVWVNAAPLYSAAGSLVGAAVLTKLRADTEADPSSVAWPEIAEAVSRDSAGHRWLQSWKEISEYVGRTPRTIQRWEMLGFPVRRPTGKPRSAVLASTAEIDAWLSSRPRLMKTRSAAGTE